MQHAAREASARVNVPHRGEHRARANGPRRAMPPEPNRRVRPPAPAAPGRDRTGGSSIRSCRPPAPRASDGGAGDRRQRDDIRAADVAQQPAFDARETRPAARDRATATRRRRAAPCAGSRSDQRQRDHQDAEHRASYRRRHGGRWARGTSGSAGPGSPPPPCTRTPSRAGSRTMYAANCRARKLSTNHAGRHEQRQRQQRHVRRDDEEPGEQRQRQQLRRRRPGASAPAAPSARGSRFRPGTASGRRAP